MKKVLILPFRFIAESWAELRKVSWLKPKAVVRLTLTVVVFSLIFSVFITGIDAAFKSGLKLIQKPTQANDTTIPADTAVPTDTTTPINGGATQ